MTPSTSIARAVSLRCENLTDPMGIDEKHPRFSWIMQDARFGARQTAYEIEVARFRSSTTPVIIWDSGKVSTDQSVLVSYDGAALASHQDYQWRVRIWDHEGRVTPWSKPARWSTGLLGKTWSAPWIGLTSLNPKESTPVRFLRTEFDLASPPRSARLYITALGLFEAHLNGARVGHDALTPGWTDYRRRVDYLTYDVTSQLRVGQNALGALLADGWYAGRLTWLGQRRLYGPVPALSAFLRIVLADGSVRTLVSDQHWHATSGAYAAADLYDGESFDRRQEPLGWTEAGFDASGWKKANQVKVSRLAIAAKPMPPVRDVQRLPAVRITEPTDTVHLLDFGQNLVGVPHVTLNESRGTKITLRFGEMLNPDGTLYTANLRSARVTDTYICRGDENEIYQPKFTFHGFRYLEITGVRQRPSRDSILAVVQQTDLPAAGSFRCSHRLLNRLQENIVWGQRSNYLEAPTDCPQRDERLGWTGDAQVFVGTAAFNYDVSTFFRKWLRDLRDGQFKNGSLPDVAPDVLAIATTQDPSRWAPHRWDGNAAWADAGVICPWTIYRRYGDVRILEENFPMMEAWIAYQLNTSRDLRRPDTEYGDWLATDAVTPGRAPTPCDLVGTAYFAESTRLVSETARVLGQATKAKKYAALHRKIATAFREEYVTPSGRVAGDTQTGYLLALAFDLLPETLRSAAVQRLVQLIENHDNRLATGFIGTPLLCPVLARFGRSDVAFRLLLQNKYPSWLYPVLNGATTMWERWNSWTKETGFGDVGMNSFNHYAYGAVGEWMYGAVGGIDPEPLEPGFARFRLRPLLSQALDSGQAEFDSPRGKIRSAWTRRGQRWTWDITVPANTQALAIVPAVTVKHVTCTSQVSRASTPLGKLHSDGVHYDLPSGRYRFVVRNARMVDASS